MDNLINQTTKQLNSYHYTATHTFSPKEQAGWGKVGEFIKRITAIVVAALANFVSGITALFEPLHNVILKNRANKHFKEGRFDKAAKSATGMRKGCSRDSLLEKIANHFIKTRNYSQARELANKISDEATKNAVLERIKNSIQDDNLESTINIQLGQLNYDKAFELVEKVSNEATKNAVLKTIANRIIMNKFPELLLIIFFKIDNVDYRNAEECRSRLCDALNLTERTNRNITRKYRRFQSKFHPDSFQFKQALAPYPDNIKEKMKEAINELHHFVVNLYDAVDSTNNESDSSSSSDSEGMQPPAPNARAPMQQALEA